MDENGSPSLAMIYANHDRGGIRDYAEDNPRLIYVTSARGPSSLIVTLIMPFGAYEDFNRTAFAEYKQLKQCEGPSNIEHVSIQKFPRRFHAKRGTCWRGFFN